jgi:tetratricopeptide (TPR) repeat protein
LSVHESAIAAARHDPVLMNAALALAENRLPDAESGLRAALKVDPFNVAAIRMMAELAGRLGRYADAEKLLRRALELAPEFTAARANLATVLHRMNRSEAAIAELDALLERDPDNSAHANLKAAASGRIGEYEEALRLYEAVLEKHPRHAKVWMSYGHVLKTVGRQADCVAAYRTAIAHAPGLGEVWWSLANLKTVTFTDADVAAMRAQLARPDLADEDRFHLDFAVGKALEDRREADAAFAHYMAGNRLRRASIDYDAGETSATVDRMIALLTPAFLAERAGQGSAAADPIFVLGMPRAGSTLIEQILASHSQVEGTMELPDLPLLARGTGRGRDADYPESLAVLDADALRSLGDRYIERTRIQRKTDRPCFIDKLPNNWLHAAFIHLILPNARIIDARRHPLACGFSNFKQHFARGQGFSYDLADIGRYYADYARLMAHIDAVLPGRVHRVYHEAMLADSEGETRRLLEACGLPFEDACLRFWETGRAVRTASSEQVRRPINRDGADAWQPFDRWLAPLKTALGDVLAEYPYPAPHVA